MSLLTFATIALCVIAVCFAVLVIGMIVDSAEVSAHPYIGNGMNFPASPMSGETFHLRGHVWVYTDVGGGFSAWVRV